MARKTSDSHKKYTSSLLWLARAALYRTDHPWCGRCGMSEARSRATFDQSLHVHHLSYENSGEGREPDTDLQTLCAFCHSLVSLKTSPSDREKLEALWVKERNVRMALIACSISTYCSMATGLPLWEGTSEVKRNLQRVREAWKTDADPDLGIQVDFVERIAWFLHGFEGNISVLKQMLSDCRRLSPAAQMKLPGGENADSGD